MDEAAWQERVAHIQATHDKLYPVSKLLQDGEVQMAMDRLNYLASREVVSLEDRWLVYQYRAMCYREMGEKDKCLACLWESVHSLEGQPLFAQKKAYGLLIFMLYEIGVPDLQLRNISFGFEAVNRQAQWYVHDKASHSRHEKIRIGYIATHFNENVISWFAIQLLAAYDRSRFEVYCYCYEKERTDKVALFIGSHVKKFYMAPYDLHTPPDIMAHQIYEDGIDILFDLMGHAEKSLGLMAAAFKPAPVQITGIGFMGTSGLSAVDYFLGDVYCDPEGLNEEDFREEILRLPHSHFCYTPSERALQVGRSYRPKRQGEEILLASFANVRKLTPQIIGLWSRILRRLPQARFLIRSSGTINSFYLRRIKNEFYEQGITQERLMFENPDLDYYDRYVDVDLLLDSYPYVGGATTCDALYMGVPMISLYGNRHGTRFGYSLLMNTGLEELTAKNEDEYVEKAVALANDTELLAALHEQIPQMFRRSPVMDAAGYLQDVQALYERIWQRWLSD